MYMIVLILEDPSLGTEVLNRWEAAGVSGVTLLPSTGLARIRRRAGLHEDFPIIPSLGEFFERDEAYNRTLMTFVRDEEMKNLVVAATQEVVGDLNEPFSGVLAVLPVAEAYGLDRRGG